MNKTQIAKDVQKGEVYLLGNTAMQGFYKIGYTKRSVQDRIKELSRATGVPASFYQVLAMPTYNPALVEWSIMNGLNTRRKNKRREFFIFENDSEAAREFLKELSVAGAYQPVTEHSLFIGIQSEPETCRELSAEEIAERKRRGDEAIAKLRSVCGPEASS